MPETKIDQILLIFIVAGLPSAGELVLDGDFGPIAEECLKELEEADEDTVDAVIAGLEALEFDVPEGEPIADVIRQIIAD